LLWHGLVSVRFDLRMLQFQELLCAVGLQSTRRCSHAATLCRVGTNPAAALSSRRNLRTDGLAVSCRWQLHKAQDTPGRWVG
jgi:hypothetical protein